MFHLLRFVLLGAVWTPVSALGVFHPLLMRNVFAALAAILCPRWRLGGHENLLRAHPCGQKLPTGLRDDPLQKPIRRSAWNNHDVSEPFYRASAMKKTSFNRK
jgi:hypothetical protein